MNRFTIVSLLLLSIFLTIFLAQESNFAIADLGRHIKNGEVFIRADDFGISRSNLLYTNLYSYTYTEFPFINHHWGSGVLMYLVYMVLGWNGLSLVYIALFLSAFILMFLISQKKAPLYALLPLALLLIPLIGERKELRPEVLSYLFLAIFIFALYEFVHNRLKRKYLFVLPLIMILWVNSHVYFVFGLFVIGAFLIETLFQKEYDKAKAVLATLVGSSLTALVNPYGFSGIIYPFTIFSNYGYKVLENQSIGYLESIGFINPFFLWWKIVVLVGVIFFIWFLLRGKGHFPIALGIIAFVFGVLSFLSIRNFSIFGLVMLPFLAHLIGGLKDSFLRISDALITGSILISVSLIMFSSVQFSSRMPWNPFWGIGLTPMVNASAEFALERGIEGPIFNNYDIGGYLIFHLFPREKVFVDNRPETYPEEFFRDIYVPMQENQGVWEDIDNEHNFNAIWFYRNDFTPWAQEFLLRMVDDPLWAPVFVDDYNIIFLKRNEKNSEIIKKFELPRTLFSRR